MAPPFSLPLAQLVGLFMESVLFGIFLVSFCACINALSNRKIVTWSDRIFLGVVLVMGFIATWNVSLLFKNVVDAFINYTGPRGPNHVFSNLSNWVTVSRGFSYGVQTLLGDSILIYRCWQVYFKKWLVVVFPILMWFGILVCVLAACIIEANLGQSSFTAKELAPFGTGFVSLTLSLNIIVTFMVAFRIWQTYSQATKYINTDSTSGHSAIKRVMLTVIESGAIYSTALLILLGVFVSGHEANVPMTDAIVQIIPIVFNVVILRIRPSRTSDRYTGHDSTVIWAERNVHRSTTGGPTSSNRSFVFNVAGSTRDESFAMGRKGNQSASNVYTPYANTHVSVA